MSLTRYGNEFYNMECVALARALLGQILVRVLPCGTRMSGRIVEVECYLGGSDEASHSKGGKRTPRNEPMFMKPGTAYVYSIYGMYHCCNISSQGEGAAVLLRALEPLEGCSEMSVRRMHSRGRRRSSILPAAKLKRHLLCNGPSKLCTSLAIDKESCNKLDMSISSTLFIEPGTGVSSEKIVVCKRIGIDSYGPEWANKPLRFYELGNVCVSVRNRDAERNLYLVNDAQPVLGTVSSEGNLPLEEVSRTS